MSDNSMWIRYFRLTVQKQRDRIAEFLNGSYLGNDAALDLSSFHVQFEISQALLNRPCTATVTIFNISAQTAAQINVKDNPLLIIEAGYQGNHAEIFRGDLFWTAFGRSSQTETYLKLVAATGSIASRYAFLNSAMPKGGGAVQQVSAVKASLSGFGAGAEIRNEGLDTAALPRGKALWGPTKYAIQNLAKTNNLEYGWGGKGLTAIPAADPGSTEVTVLDPSSGLLDRPTVSVDGVRAVSLLNPSLEMGHVVNIRGTVNGPDYDTSTTQQAISANAVANGDFIDPYGYYKIYARSHRGDTRGGTWETEIQCAGLGSKYKPGTFSSTPFQYAKNHSSDEMGVSYK